MRYASKWIETTLRSTWEDHRHILTLCTTLLIRSVAFKHQAWAFSLEGTNTWVLRRLRLDLETPSVLNTVDP